MLMKKLKSFNVIIISYLIIAYAYGGFDFINSKVIGNPAFFDDDCFVKLLKEVEPFNN